MSQNTGPAPRTFSLWQLVGCLVLFGFIALAVLILAWVFAFSGLLSPTGSQSSASPTAAALVSLEPSAGASASLAPGETPTASASSEPTPGDSGQGATPTPSGDATPKPGKTPKPTRSPKPTKEATPTPEQTPTSEPTPTPTPLSLNGGNETTWTSKQKRDQPDPTPSPLLDTAHSTLEIRFKVFEGQVTQSDPNRDSNAEVDVDVNSNDSKVLANGNIKIVVTLTNGGSPRGAYVFTVNQINGETLKGTYKFTGSTGDEETGSFTMTHT